MKRCIIRFLTIASFLAINSFLAFGQTVATAPLAGTISDPTGAVIAGASVTVKNKTTGTEFKATTSNTGAYTVPALGPGTYTLTVEASGFKKAVVQDVKIDVGVPATANITMEVGAASESVVIQGGAEVLQTQTANVATTITGREITELPLSSRDALDLVLTLPGTTTPGRPRTSTIDGLPKGSLNITMDGVNVQDNDLKSSDGFFTYIRPRLDAIDEVTVSTATPGAESSGEGAVQLKFVTRSGNNEFHGSVYEYHRNPALNANYWFNNRDIAADPRTGKAPRDRILLNQYGFRVGGPIIKDRAFFFVNYEEYRLPEQSSRQRTILSPLAQSGVYQYQVGGDVKSVNLFNLPGATTPDPTVSKLLADIRQSTTTTGGINPNTGDPNTNFFSFINTGGQKRYFPTVRLDFNLTSKQHIENTWNYQNFGGVVDFLNNADPAFPGFPNHGSQVSNRFSNVTALRSTLSSTLVNEARFGLTGGTLLFFPEVSTDQFTNQGGYSLNLNPSNVTLNLTNPTVQRAPSRRNSPVWQFNDTLNWSRGSHNVNFGFSFTQVNLWSSGVADGVVRSITFGLVTGDPAQGLFTPDNFPNATTAQLDQARSLYALLAGRVSSVSGQLALNENTNQYALNGNLVQRARQRETGLFAQDSWRFRQNLTLTGGVRWEVQYPFTALNNNFSQTTYAGLFGVSGEGNFFQPGVTPGSVTQFTQFKPGDRAFDTKYKNFAPSLGLAWSPNFKNSVFKRVFGEGGQSVFRAGYSIAYNREGMDVLSAILGSNPGGTLSATQSVANGRLPDTGIALGGIPPLSGLATAPGFPITSTTSQSANGFLPGLDTGYVQSWTLGWQRELSKDTAVEVRYVGNRGIKLWRQYNINEVNLVENGFINEFKAAQRNLAICQQNATACTQAQTASNLISANNITANNFANWGLPGQSPLPNMLAFFGGTNGAASFRNSTFLNALDPTRPNAISFATSIYQNPTLVANGTKAGLPRNFFVTNPDVDTALGGSGGAFLVDNSGRTSYDALVIELRRRLSKGLLVQGSYTFDRAFTNMFASSSSVFSQPRTLRDPGLDKSPSPFGITHSFKTDWIYELPFGRGKAFLANSGKVLDRVVGGWEYHGTARIQTGTPFDLGNVQLVGMTVSELRDAVQVRKEPNRIAYFLPQDIIDNTRRAYGTLSGTPTGKYIAPPNYQNPVAFNGQAGFSHVVLYGPSFARFDMSAVKKFRITERVNFELRAELLDAFNNINFIVGNAGNDVNTVTVSSTAFGQLTQAYRDTSTTNDPGGRLIQIVGRINF
ncbi:MAG: TonB-dependent receptor [Blastocatellia bacterium]|nr:TonB-dependent receptor [Blastocatellia bacterium]